MAEMQAVAEKGHEENEAIVKATFVIGILALGATFVVSTILERKHIHWIPEAGVGVIIGGLCSATAALFGMSDMLAQEKFDFEFFMIWLLPPIIFEAGFNMDVESFFMNSGPTMFFAFVGTFASTFIVGGIVYAAGQIGLCYPLGLLASLTFGSLISATDPVTVLAVFQALGVKIDLFSMVFGESVLNDAVAIVLSRTLLSFNKPGAVVDQSSVLEACVLFLTIFLGSTVIGVAYGLLSSFVFKKLNLAQYPTRADSASDETPKATGALGLCKMSIEQHEDEKEPSEERFVEAALSFSFPWAAYFTAESLSLSGIVSILFCGIVMAKLTRENFTLSAQTLTADAYKTVAKVAETYVFIYLGMATVTFPIFSHTVWMLVLVSIAACFVGRLHIYVGSLLTNLFRRGVEGALRPISAVYMFVMWFSGLRGGVAFALAANSFAQKDFPSCGFKGECTGEKGEMNDSTAILQTTMIIALFTIFVFGGAITYVAEKCDVIDKGAKVDPISVHHPGLLSRFTNRRFTRASVVAELV